MIQHRHSVFGLIPSMSINLPAYICEYMRALSDADVGWSSVCVRVRNLSACGRHLEADVISTAIPDQANFEHYASSSINYDLLRRLADVSPGWTVPQKLRVKGDLYLPLPMRDEGSNLVLMFVKDECTRILTVPIRAKDTYNHR